MKFNSKAHMAQELVAGKLFKDRRGLIIQYSEKFTNPFRYGVYDMSCAWDKYSEDIWTEVTPVHTHQDLIDSYQSGQAWQCTVPSMYGVYADCVLNGVWIKPSWDERITYRLHPHNALIQAHQCGAKIQAYVDALGAWVEQANPDWDTDVQYRVKPTTKVIHEWMFMAKLSYAWELEALLLSEEEAGEFYGDAYKYQKTGRSWEVEA